MSSYALSFLEDDFPHMAELSKNSEKLINMGFGQEAISDIGKVAEMITKKVCTFKGWRDLIEDSEGFVSQKYRVNNLYYEKKIFKRNIYQNFKSIIDARNPTTHPDEDKPILNSLNTAKKIHKDLFIAAKWFSYEFSDNISVKDLDYPGIIYIEDKVDVESEETISTLEQELKNRDTELENKLKENEELRKAKDLTREENEALIQENKKYREELSRIQALEEEIARLKSEVRDNNYEEIQSQHLELIQDIKRIGKSIQQMSDDKDLEKLKEDYTILLGMFNQMSDELYDLSNKTEFEDIKTQNLEILQSIKVIESELIDASASNDITLLKEQNQILINKIKEIEDHMMQVSKIAEEKGLNSRKTSLSEEISNFESKYYDFYPPSLEHIRKFKDKYIVFNKDEEFGTYDTLTEAIKIRDELIEYKWAFKDQIKEVSMFIYKLNKKFILKTEIHGEDRVFGVFDSKEEADEAELKAMNVGWNCFSIPFEEFNFEDEYSFEL